MRKISKHEIIAIALAIVVAGFFFGFGKQLFSKKDNNIQMNNQSDQSQIMGGNATSSIKVRGDGLVIEDIVPGSGEEALSGKKVTVHYVGTLTSGKKFDSSVDRGILLSFVLGNGEVIAGWDAGVAGMKVGGKRKLIVPPELGYGSQQITDNDGNVILPANSTLIFEVELLKIE